MGDSVRLAAVRLLWPYERVARRPLRPWAAALADRLERQDHVSAWEIGTCLNQAALVATHLGHFALARSMCEAQLAWARRLADDDPGAAVLLLQPWLNVGRLHVLEGRHDAGRRHFAIAVDALRAVPTEVAGRHFDEDTWHAIDAADPDAVRATWNVYVVETVESWLAEERPSAALACARSAARFEPSPTVASTEALGACAAEFGDLDGVQAMAEGGNDGALSIALAVHLQRALRRAGHADRADVVATRVALVLNQRDWGDIAAVELPRWFPLVTAALDSVRTTRQPLAEELSEELATTLLELARRADDEIVTIRALRARSALRGEVRGATDARAADELVTASDHASARGAIRLAPVQVAAVEPYRRLVDAVGRTTGRKLLPSNPDARVAATTTGTRREYGKETVDRRATQGS